MKFNFFLLFPIISLFSCGGTEEQAAGNNSESKDTNLIEIIDTVETTSTQLDSSMLPKRILKELNLILGQADGDLDKDGIAEKVVVFSRDLEFESPEPRDLIIYKQKDGVWEEWISTDNAILHADEGGMMGDPFYGEVNIVNGILEISHSGGSSWKWGHTDKYRYQNGDFYLIGYSSTYGKPWEYWEECDYNLSTGDCVYTFEPDEDEEAEPSENYGPKRKEKFNHKMKELPKLTNRRNINYEFESPKGEKIYL